MIKGLIKYAGRRKAYSGIRSLLRSNSSAASQRNSVNVGDVTLGPKIVNNVDKEILEELAVIKSQLQGMDPYQFEELIGDVWTERGYTTDVVGGKGDGGVDIIAQNGREAVAIQAKRYGPNTTVGPNEIREIAALSHREDVTSTALVTTSTLTEAARKESVRYDVSVYNGDEFMILMDGLEAQHLLAEYLPAVSLK